jgi:putative DNA primase/helicase
MPERVRAATSDYRKGEDLLLRWLDERCRVDLADTNYRTRASDLYTNFRQWCERGGEDAPTQRVFGEAMTERGFSRKVSDGVWYVGIIIATDEREP